MDPNLPTVPEPSAPVAPRRRRLWLLIAAGAAALVLLVLLWRPLVAWFAGKPMGGGTSEEVTSQAGGLTLEAALRPDPPRLEDNTLLLILRGPGGEAVEDADLEVEVTMPAMGAMPEMRSRGQVEEQGDGSYRAEFDLQMTGTWTVEVDVRSEAGAASQRYSLTVGTKGLTAIGGTAAAASATAPALAPRRLPDASLAPLRDAFAAYEEARKLLAGDRTERLAQHARRLGNALVLARSSFAGGDREVLGWLDQAAQAA
ncbi:MAG: FixH family protein, partial [Thermoanaerobaculia bacterium]